MVRFGRETAEAREQKQVTERADGQQTVLTVRGLEDSHAKDGAHHQIRNNRSNEFHAANVNGPAAEFKRELSVRPNALIAVWAIGALVFPQASPDLPP